MNKTFIILAVLATFTYCIFWYAFPKNIYSNELSVYLLDIGQGDAMYVRAPDGSDMLIDGGPAGYRSETPLLRELKTVMPFDDKHIDVLVVTNPDADHFAGFNDLLKSYTVGAVIEPGTHSDTKTYKIFESLVAEKKIPKVIARKGMRVVLDKNKGIEYDVLFPDRNVSVFSRNDGSIVGKLVYNKKSFILTGDATSYTESLVLASNSKETLKSDVLKIGHHGSRTSTSQKFLQTVAPVYAIISAGRNNRYGHPHLEIINRLKNFGAQILGTYQNGTITCMTDGVILTCNG